MPKIKKLHIGQLQPTQTHINHSYTQGIKPPFKLIEVIKIEHNHYVVDGHHTLYACFDQGIETIAINCQDFTNSKPQYQLRHKEKINKILEKVEKVQKQGMTHISHLELI